MRYMYYRYSNVVSERLTEQGLEESTLEDTDHSLDGSAQGSVLGLAQSTVVVLQQLQGPVGIWSTHRHAQ